MKTTEIKDSAIYEMQFLKEKLSMLNASFRKAKKEFDDVCDLIDKTYNVRILAQKSAELSILTYHISYVESESKEINKKLETLNARILN